ncbi:MAG TPA: UDP-glucose 4-epimerase GalE, partial [Streptosporangiaceae bacterium]
YSNLEVLQTCREVTGHEIPSRIAPRRPGDPPVLIASSERFHAERDWRPEAGLVAIITDAWQFARGQPR